MAQPVVTSNFLVTDGGDGAAEFQLNAFLDQTQAASRPDSIDFKYQIIRLRHLGRQDSVIVESDDEFGYTIPITDLYHERCSQTIAYYVLYSLGMTTDSESLWALERTLATFLHCAADVGPGVQASIGAVYHTGLVAGSWGESSDRRGSPSRSYNIEMLTYPELIAAGEAFDDKDCSICLEEFVDEKGMRLAKTPCSHVFHDRCLARWLSLGTSSSCPVCRSNI